MAPLSGKARVSASAMQDKRAAKECAEEQYRQETGYEPGR